VSALDAWIAEEARIAAAAMLAAISATHLVKNRSGFGQRIVPRPGSILASPVLAAYDPDPDYFFHWFRDSAVVIDALRVALAANLVERRAAVERFAEFIEFGRRLRDLDGGAFLARGNFREKVQAPFLQYVRPDAEIAALSGETVLGDVRVNPDGTPDISRWARPQFDGTALRAIALFRWWRAQPPPDEAVLAAMRQLVAADLWFALANAEKPSFDIWEEESGHHYYSLLVQTEALRRGAEWLAEIGDVAGARACGGLAAELGSSLENFWDEIAGYYRSRMGVTSGKPGKDLDIAVILAVLHAGRAAGPHSVLDPKVQATLAALEDLFEADYAINRYRPPERGPALGRYAIDVYYSGGAYFFATLAAAEFYFRLASALLSGGELAVTSENRRFRERLGTTVEATGSREAAAAAMQRGDAIMRTVRAFTSATGDLSEQFDRTTGAQTSAKHLTWSYAAFITAAASRDQARKAGSASFGGGNAMGS
jgi:glucoamylase